MDNHASIGTIGKKFKITANMNRAIAKIRSIIIVGGNILLLHLQTAVLCLVCEACKARRRHESLTESPLKFLKGPLCPETTLANWLPVQRAAWPETAPRDMPAAPVI